jgi:hypothetical protein
LTDVNVVVPRLVLLTSDPDSDEELN